MMDNSLDTWLASPRCNRQHFRLDAAQWEAFMANLEAASCPLPALERLMREPSVFEPQPGKGQG
jgi:hypothetical protein